MKKILPTLLFFFLLVTTAFAQSTTIDVEKEGLPGAPLYDAILSKLGLFDRLRLSLRGITSPQTIVNDNICSEEPNSQGTFTGKTTACISTGSHGGIAYQLFDSSPGVWKYIGEKTSTPGGEACFTGLDSSKTYTWTLYYCDSPQSQQGCFDSDGPDIFEKGYVTKDGGRIDDACSTSTKVWEQTCKDGFPYTKTFDCTNYGYDACQNAVCVKTTTPEPVTDEEIITALQPDEDTTVEEQPATTNGGDTSDKPVVDKVIITGTKVYSSQVNPGKPVSVQFTIHNTADKEYNVGLLTNPERVVKVESGIYKKSYLQKNFPDAYKQLFSIGGRAGVTQVDACVPSEDFVFAAEVTQKLQPDEDATYIITPTAPTTDSRLGNQSQESNWEGFGEYAVITGSYADCGEGHTSVWFNKVNVVEPVVPTHKVNLGATCVVIEGEGDDECDVDDGGGDGAGGGATNVDLAWPLTIGEIKGATDAMLKNSLCNYRIQCADRAGYDVSCTRLEEIGFKGVDSLEPWYKRAFDAVTGAETAKKGLCYAETGMVYCDFASSLAFVSLSDDDCASGSIVLFGAVLALFAVFAFAGGKKGGG